MSVVHLLWLTLLCLLEIPHITLICPIMKSAFVYDGYHFKYLLTFTTDQLDVTEFFVNGYYY